MLGPELRALHLRAGRDELEGATLRIEHVPVRVACWRCAVDTETDEFPLACEGCGSVDVDVAAGDELLVESLELEEAVPVGGR